MATTYPLATLAPTVTAAGISAPPYIDILESLKASFRLIYGEDAYLEPDSQDGQWVAILAQAQHDTNDAVIAAYNNFSPQTAVGVGLSSVIKINHMARRIATNSQVDVTVTGVAGTTITNGIVGGVDGKRWLLPASVVIPPAGTITATAIAEEAGALTAPPASVVQILTPTAGWQTALNANAAVTGTPLESDALLRVRQEQSPPAPSAALIPGLKANLLALPGVSYAVVYENDTASVNSIGLPAHSISCVVKGGVLSEVAQMILNKKTPGALTVGTTTVNAINSVGLAQPINYYQPGEISVKVKVTMTVGLDYVSSTGVAIQNAVVDFINALSVGESLVVNRLFTPVLILGKPESETYVVVTLLAARFVDAFGTTTITPNFHERLVCSADNVTIDIV